MLSASEMILEAVRRLKSGDVVGVPTETVYGLAAAIGSEIGLTKIFTLKERPFFDPLIVHVPSVRDVLKVSARVTELEQMLMAEFWPGPLTVILPKAESLNPLITAGLESVGVRCPSHPLALEILHALGEPFAAPSANKFGRTSPTQARHVRDEFPNILIIDGGESSVGLESTVLRVNEGDKQIEIYRPGAITREMLCDFLKLRGFDYSVQMKQSPVAPGQLQYHYQPPLPVVMSDEWPISEDLQIELSKFGVLAEGFAALDLGDNPLMAARVLYQRLRDLSQTGATAIVILRREQQESGVWDAIWNRVEKAATFVVKNGKVIKR